MSKVLGIDIGSKIIGLAVGSQELAMAFPRESILKSDKQGFEKILTLIKEEGVELVVAGLPLTLSGEEGRSAEMARKYIERLRKRIAVPIVVIDESHSTDEAREKFTTTKGLKQSGRLDAASAVIILNRYFESVANK